MNDSKLLLELVLFELRFLGPDRRVNQPINGHWA